MLVQSLPTPSTSFFLFSFFFFFSLFATVYASAKMICIEVGYLQKQTCSKEGKEKKKKHLTSFSFENPFASSILSLQFFFFGLLQLAMRMGVIHVANC